MQKITNILASLLLFGIVDQVNDNRATIEYTTNYGTLEYTTVDLDLSACDPVEGQSVYFFKDYKIVSCEE